MRDCPRCDQHTLDVTGEKINEALKFRCWICGFECFIEPLSEIEIENIRKYVQAQLSDLACY